MKINTINSIYQDFYGKEPNFSEENFENLTIEMQAMAYILEQSGEGLSIISDGFVKEGYIDLTLPMSMGLQDTLVDHRRKTQEDSKEKVKEKLKESARKKIALIGKVVKENIASTPNPIETLRQIVYVSFIRERVWATASEEEIASLSGCNLESVIREKKLAIAIRDELAKENYDRSNLESVSERIENGDIPDKAFRPIPNESGPVHVFVSKENRKNCARDLCK